jgi:hypothetical protein
MADLAIFETGDGGDVILKGNDLELTEGLFNLPYLALFGGNLLQSTDELPIEPEGLVEREDWWGNELFFPNSEKLQFNSKTERRLNEVALNSNALIIIEAIVKEDLKFMNEFAEVSVEVTIPDRDTLKIFITLQEPDGLEEQTFVFAWTATKLEEIVNGFVGGGVATQPLETLVWIDSNGNNIVDENDNFIIFQ